MRALAREPCSPANGCSSPQADIALRQTRLGAALLSPAMIPAAWSWEPKHRDGTAGQARCGTSRRALRATTAPVKMNVGAESTNGNLLRKSSFLISSITLLFSRENHLSPSSPTSPGPRCPISPHPPTERSRAGVDPTLPSDELVQRLRIRLVRRHVPHNAAPLASGAFVRLCRVGSAPKNRGERVFPIRHTALRYP